MGRKAVVPMLAAAAILSGGCNDELGQLGDGETCARTSQCQDGLACVTGRCTTDLGPLLEAGTLPPFDAAGLFPDGAAEVDAGPMGVDAGPMGVDAGPMGVDAGPMGIDAGPPDAGPMDAGPMDAGPMDAGPVDAGPVDSGPEDAG